MYNSGRKSVTIEMRYDPRDISRLYFISDEQKLAQAPLNINKTGMQGYIGMTEYELKMYKKEKVSFGWKIKNEIGKIKRICIQPRN